MISYFNAYVLYPALERFSKREIQTKLRELRRYDRLTIDQQRDLQKRQCYLMLEYCKNHVPYYQGIFTKLNFNTESVLKDIRFIQDLPILTKALVRDHSNSIKAPHAHHMRKTGGSTGQSVFFHYDNVGLDWTSAMHLWAYEMVGKKRHHLDCHISADLELLGLRNESPKGRILDWLKLFSQNRSRLMVGSFAEEDLKKVYLDLKRINPYLLQGHPSSAYAIASYIEEHNLSGAALVKIFEPSGEMLSRKIVDSIEKNLGCKVVNRYGNAECGVMAHSMMADDFNRLKIFTRAFHIEECKDSALIVSNFTNLGFPLIRYDTGDIGSVCVESDGTFLYDIQGRIHDRVLILGKAYPTHLIMDALDHKIRQVREFQIIVNDNLRPQLNIVVEFIGDELRIRNEIEKIWPNGFDIHFVKFENLRTVGWRQKFRHIIDERSK